MAEEFRKSSRKYLLPDWFYDIERPNPEIIRQINSLRQVPFQYTSWALLSPEGKAAAKHFAKDAGRCLGGGVLASRDLDWYSTGMEGEQPAEVLPKGGFFSGKLPPQSYIESEWVAFEYAILFLTRNNGIINSWDSISNIKKLGKQGSDIYVRFEGRFAGKFTRISAQSNKWGMTTLLQIAELTGVPVN